MSSNDTDHIANATDEYRLYVDSTVNQGKSGQFFFFFIHFTIDVGRVNGFCRPKRQGAVLKFQVLLK